MLMIMHALTLALSRPAEEGIWGVFEMLYRRKVAESCRALRQVAATSGKLCLERQVRGGGVLLWDSWLGVRDGAGIGVFGVGVVGFRGIRGSC